MLFSSSKFKYEGEFNMRLISLMHGWWCFLWYTNTISTTTCNCRRFFDSTSWRSTIFCPCARHFIHCKMHGKSIWMKRVNEGFFMLFSSSKFKYEGEFNMRLISLMHEWWSFLWYTNTITVLTTSTEIILGTRKCGPCQEQVFIYFKLQEAIKNVTPLDLWKKDHSRIITE